MGAPEEEPGEAGDPGSRPRRSVLRIAAWACIGLAVALCLVAGDVRTAWLVGDTEPIGAEVTLPRLAAVALMAGLVLLAIHQLRSRRSLPQERYRGPSILVLLGLIIGLSTLLALPMRNEINLLFRGGIPDWPPIAIWFAAASLALLLVSWLAVLRPRALHGVHLFASSRPIRHALLGVAVGIPTSILALVAGAAVELASRGAPMQITPTGEGLLPPSMPAFIGVVFVVLLGPVAEEVFFRGVVLNAWLREYGVHVAVAGSSILFGAAHFGLAPLQSLPEALPRLTILALGGVVLAIVAIRTRSLIAPIAAHAAMNGTLLALGAVLSELTA